MSGFFKKKGGGGGAGAPGSSAIHMTDVSEELMDGWVGGVWEEQTVL